MEKTITLKPENCRVKCTPPDYSSTAVLDTLLRGLAGMGLHDFTEAVYSDQKLYDYLTGEEEAKCISTN